MSGDRMQDDGQVAEPEATTSVCLCESRSPPNPTPLPPTLPRSPQGLRLPSALTSEGGGGGGGGA